MLGQTMAAVGACALAASAHGSVFFTFADDNTPLEVNAVAPAQGETSGSLTYGSQLPQAPVFNFQVDASMEGGAISQFNAILEWDLEVGSVNGGTPEIAVVTGGFLFRDADTDEVILSGDIGEAMLVLSGNVGSLLSASDEGLTYAPGPALLAKDPTVTNLQGAFDGVYTLTDIQFDGDRTVTRGDLGFFGSFDANAAFTGTAASIPAPSGAIVLAGIGGLVAWRTRSDARAS